MPITPQTDIKLLKVPITLDNKNQLTFSNVTEQYNYFNSLPKLEVDNCTYQRKDNVLRYPSHIDTIINYNYCIYQNENYTNKWFYAFITNMRYVNDNLTEITLKTDVFQTWQFDLTYKNSFIEREHVNDDTIGLHTIDENLRVGEVRQDEETEDASLSEFTWLAIASSWNPSTSEQFSGITVYNKEVFGNEIHLIKCEPISNLRNFLLYLLKTNADGHIEDINDVFIIPDALIDINTLTLQTGTIGDNNFTFYKLPFSEDVESFEQTITKHHTFSDYSPKNNKCFCYPYNYLYVTNNIGSFNIFKYEDFSSNDCIFKTELAMSVGGSGKLTPLSYKNKVRDDDESLPLAKYPTCGWSVDSYINWLTQNAINMPTKIFNSLMTPITGVMNNTGVSQANSLANTGNAGVVSGVVNTTVNTINQISSVINDFYQAELMPNIQCADNVGDVNFSAKRNTFTFRKMRAKKEYLEIIDNYFSMFGYKVNAMKIPNINGRQNWNFVKTIDINILGNIPQYDLQEIKNMFNNGITFWHKPSTFLDYSQSNNII